MQTTRTAYRIAAAAMLVGVVGIVVVTVILLTAVQDPFAHIPAASYMRGILHARNAWIAIHLAFAIGSLLKLAGLMGLGDVLEQGPARPIARMGNAMAICGVGLFVVTMVHDGYVHEHMATGWAAASGGAQAAWIPIFASGIQTTLGMELASIVAWFGLAPIAYGISMLSGSTYPRWLSWMGIVGGVGAIVTAITLWTTGYTDFGYSVLYPIFATLLPAVWYVGIAVMLWRRGADAAIPGGQPSTPRVTDVAPADSVA